MSNWQEWVVGALIVLCVCRMIYGVIVFFRRMKNAKNPCDTCASGCELKDIVGKKCGEYEVKKKRFIRN